MTADFNPAVFVVVSMFIVAELVRLSMQGMARLDRLMAGSRWQAEQDR